MSAPESALAVVTICKVVCERHGVTLDDLFSDRKWQPVAKARQEAMRLIRDVTGLSYPQIGRIFDRDHTTVLHACRVEESRDYWRIDEIEVTGPTGETAVYR